MQTVCMKQFDVKHLDFFTGTTAYYVLAPKTRLTNGAKCLADQAKTYWLMDQVAKRGSLHVNAEQILVRKHFEGVHNLNDLC